MACSKFSLACFKHPFFPVGNAKVVVKPQRNPVESVTRSCTGLLPDRSCLWIHRNAEVIMRVRIVGGHTQCHHELNDRLIIQALCVVGDAEVDARIGISRPQA